MFVSPTKLLLQYLRQNMQYEGLTTNGENTVTVNDFRGKMMREYQLFSLKEDSPFKSYKTIDGRYTALILKPKEIVDRFEKFGNQNLFMA